MNDHSTSLELFSATLKLDIDTPRRQRRRDFDVAAIGLRTIEHGVAYDAATRLGIWHVDANVPG